LIGINVVKSPGDEAAGAFEMLVPICDVVWHHIPEDQNVSFQRNILYNE
jgi:hypothetical protein